MIVILAEKPSVARSIASVVKANQKKDGYLEGNQYAVSWAFGHLIQLAMPESYGFEGFKKENLPIIPQQFKLTPKKIKDGKNYIDDPGSLKQINIIKNLFDTCEKIIVATDAGREGELIFRYIYNYLNCQKPFYRLWISSLTEKAIKEGMDNIQLGSNFDNLYYAAQMRSEADWLVGINASQALTLAAGSGVFSLGRVQTPTLAMICKRYLENVNFTPVPYWQIKLTLKKDHVVFTAISENFDDIQSANNAFEKVKNSNSIEVKTVDTKVVNQEAPLFHDLTSLQREANSKNGFTADKTLSVAQKLYESQYITYPRTGSRYLSKDVFETLSELVPVLYDHPKYGNYAKELNNFNDKGVNDSKVTDHHAIIITEKKPTQLAPDEQIIYDLIIVKMLEALSEKCIKEITTVNYTLEGISFTTKGTLIKQQGWRKVNNEKENDNEDENLPVIAVNEQIPIDNNVEQIEKKTKPKALYTDASLLSAMENAGKELEDVEQRKILSDIGIGTPATRAAILETLIHRNYIKREKKTIVPTSIGLSVYEVVKDQRIANVELTGMWESALLKIEKSEMTKENLQKSIEVFTRQITTDLLNTTIKVERTDQTMYKCPKCQKDIINFNKVLKCSSSECGFVLFKEISGKQLNEKQISALLSNKKTDLIKGLNSKSGKKFDAYLQLNQEFKVEFSFPAQKKKK